MAAGQGFKTFATGDVLTAADTNGYLMQGVWVFADAAARDAAVTSPQEGNMCYLKSTDAVQSYSGSAWIAVGGSGSVNVAGKNAVINSAFQVWQRGTSFANTAQTIYTADRWVTVGTPAAYTISRQVTGDTTNLPNIQYCARIQRNSGQTNTTGFDLVQGLESVNSIPFAGKTVTLSFYARKGSNYSPTSSILAAALYSGTGTDQSPTSAFTGQVAVINQNATLTTTWQRFTYTASVASSATQLKTIFSMAPTGTASTNDFYEITGVQLEISGSATDFSTATNTIQAELALCQRYYYRSKGDNLYTVLMPTGITFSTTAAVFYLSAPTSMRVTPTAVDYSTITALDSTNFNGFSPSGVTIGTACGTRELSVELVISGATSGRIMLLRGNNSASAYIGFSAEL